ncbi:hypothetical protein AB0M68_19155 [Streptomyces sp. NPDC051453]|uniref:hypothetical protein n=1 Tax=Streptomyces sp. NPDC051453 TaxID=3154941 RepID=UPI00341FE546
MTLQAADDASANKATIPSPRMDTLAHTGGVLPRESHRWHERLCADLRILGIADPVPLRVRVALHRRAHLSAWTQRLVWTVVFLIGLSVATIVTNVLSWLIVGHSDSDSLNEQNPLTHQERLPWGLLKPTFVAYWSELPVTVGSAFKLVLGITLAFAVVWTAVMVLVAYALGPDRRPSYDGSSWPGATRWSRSARMLCTLVRRRAAAAVRGRRRRCARCHGGFG